MNEYLVFDINEKINEINLSEDMLTNLDKTISDILKKNKTNSIKYCVKDKKDKNHPINSLTRAIWKRKNSFSEKKFKSEAEKLAERLLSVELIKDGSQRKKSITKGMLFFKGNKNQVTIIKLESTEIMDNKTFELKEALNLDKHYYKITTIKNGQLDNINIVDKNKNVAKFWANEFLNLSRVRDSSTNTTTLFEKLKKDLFFTDSVKEDENYGMIKRDTMEFLETHKDFTEEDLFNFLTIADKEITTKDIVNQSIYDDMDDSFKIDKNTVLSNAKGKIQVSKSIEILSSNLFGEIRDKNIKLKGNKLEIRINKTFLEQTKGYFD